MSLSPAQLQAIETTERVTSVFSLIGSGFVIATFVASSAFHKPVNRLVFYASWGNMATNVATLISRSGIRAGVNAPLCQLQAFIIQMFMPADSLWTLAMACNVYLTFFRRYSASQLRALEWKYVILCYGIPFIPAIVFVFTQTEARGRIFGSATLWCWVAVEWNALRIAAFYGPVWVVLISTLIIYALAGKEIYEKREALKSLSAPQAYNFGEDMTINSKTTDIRITSEAVQGERKGAYQFDDLRRADAFHASRKYPQYAVNIQSSCEPQTTRDDGRAQRNIGSSSDRAAWAYVKCALLFFIALLITWVPSTINRVYSLVHAGEVSFTLNYIESLVLPLQGFWNSVIYIATSLPACGATWNKVRGRATVGSFAMSDMRNMPREGKRLDKSESMTELATDHQSRPMKSVVTEGHLPNSVL